MIYAFPTTLNEADISKWFANEIRMLSESGGDTLKVINGVNNCYFAAQTGEDIIYFTKVYLEDDIFKVVSVQWLDKETILKDHKEEFFDLTDNLIKVRLLLIAYF